MSTNSRGYSIPLSVKDWLTRDLPPRGERYRLTCPVCGGRVKPPKARLAIIACYRDDGDDMHAELHCTAVDDAHDIPNAYLIDVDLADPADLVDTIHHLSGKGWHSDAYMLRLVGEMGALLARFIASGNSPSYKKPASP